MELRDAAEWIGLPAAGGLVGWLGGRRKNKAEAVSIEIQALRDTITILQETIERQDGRLKAQEERIQLLENLLRERGL